MLIQINTGYFNWLVRIVWREGGGKRLVCVAGDGFWCVWLGMVIVESMTWQCDSLIEQNQM